jgi:hypothetical protein
VHPRDRREREGELDALDEVRVEARRSLERGPEVCDRSRALRVAIVEIAELLVVQIDRRDRQDVAQRRAEVASGGDRFGGLQLREERVDLCDLRRRKWLDHPAFAGADEERFSRGRLDEPHFGERSDDFAGNDRVQRGHRRNRQRIIRRIGVGQPERGCLAVQSIREHARADANWIDLGESSEVAHVGFVCCGEGHARSCELRAHGGIDTLELRRADVVFFAAHDEVDFYEPSNSVERGRSCDDRVVVVLVNSEHHNIDVDFAGVQIEVPFGVGVEGAPSADHVSVTVQAPILQRARARGGRQGFGRRRCSPRRSRAVGVPVVEASLAP